MKVVGAKFGLEWVQWRVESKTLLHRRTLLSKKKGAVNEEKGSREGFPEMGEITIYATCNDVIQDKLRQS